MTIRVRYFARKRDQIGRSEDQLIPEEAMTVADIWQRLCPDIALPPNTLSAVNMEYTDLNKMVRDGDEVAFFPPVTGG